MHQINYFYDHSVGSTDLTVQCSRFLFLSMHLIGKNSTDIYLPYPSLLSMDERMLNALSIRVSRKARLVEEKIINLAGEAVLPIYITHCVPHNLLKDN